MHPYYLLIFFTLHVGGMGLKAQNLVPNPGFELLKKSPCRAVTNFPDNISNYVYNWVAPTGGTSDVHLNTAIADSCPINLSKYGLKAHSGIVCAGLFTLGNSPRLSANSGVAAYREYLQVKLSQKLIIGKIYYVEFYASPFNVNLNSITSCYSNNIGCYFSVDSIYKSVNRQDQFTELSFKPQINESRILDKPGEWYKISGCFQAKEAAQYITIGNFFGDQQTQYIEADQRGRGAYYLVDDVSVIETGLPMVPLLALNDTTLCPGQTLGIHLTNDAQIGYRWQDNSTSANYIIRQPRVYSVTATSGPCVVNDTFRVAQEPVLKLPSDTVLCQGSTFLLNPINYSTLRFTWSDGSQQLTLPVQESGIYWAKSQSAICPQADSIKVTFLPCPGSIPNVFTPNRDGINDTFYIDGIILVPWRLEIVNRWGKNIYESEAYKNDWAGEGLPAGVYYYLLSNAELQKQFKGWVQILR